MADPKTPTAESAPVRIPEGIEWETPRTRPAKPSLFRRLWGPTVASTSTGPSRFSTPPQPASTSTDKAPGTIPTATSTGTDTASHPSVLDRLLPPDRTYLRLSRGVFLLLLLLSTLSSLALILGLSLGLTLPHHHPQSLPLPSDSGAIYTGDLTYYTPGLGACGWTSSASDAVVAVSHTVFDAAGDGSSDPNANPLCGKKIRVERNQGDGRGNRSVDVVVVDRCVGCQPTDLDLSPSAFEVLADEALGRVVGSWAWLG